MFLNTSLLNCSHDPRSYWLLGQLMGIAPTSRKILFQVLPRLTGEWWSVNKTGCCVIASNADRAVLISSSDAAWPGHKKKPLLCCRTLGDSINLCSSNFFNVLGLPWNALTHCSFQIRLTSIYWFYLVLQKEKQFIEIMELFHATVDFLFTF